MRNLWVGDGLGSIHQGLVRSITWPTRGVLAIAVLSLAMPASAQVEPSGTVTRSPAEIVKNYVRLDMKGARLDAMSFDALRPYIEWNEEPAWRSVVVIQDVDVPEDYRKWEIINNLEVVIPVTFHVRGSVHFDTAVFVPEEKTEEVRFHVKGVRNEWWRIVAPMVPPHIGLKRMLNFVREAELHEQDASQRAVLAALADSLRKSK